MRGRRGSAHRELWTPEMLRRKITNPVYAGMGPYPPLVDDEAWITANVRLIREEGAAATLRSVLARFREAFPTVQPPEPGTYIREADTDAESALRHLLVDLRSLFGFFEGTVQ